MDTQQLKLLAATVRALLEQSNHSIGHGQSLDLVAAIPGLRNWPEVQAFPDRVAATELDLASAGRLAFRLQKKFGLGLESREILELLAPSMGSRTDHSLAIWPAGPRAGVYITTSPDAINALLAAYEEATDGALIYAESAGRHWKCAIDLGDDGLWSNGLDRVPSGTLLVIGPVELNQQMWGSSAERVEMACLRALNSGHRVAILVDTPTPEFVHEDINLLVRSIPGADDDTYTALTGSVTESGELQARLPFARPWPQLRQTVSTPSAVKISEKARELLREQLKSVHSGILLIGSTMKQEHPAIELVADSLALTEHLGPAARVMPRNRSTPEKDWLVPDSIKELPFLPSIQSAYAQGYRRIVVSPSYTRSESIMEYGKDALLICGAYGASISQTMFSATRSLRPELEKTFLPLIVAALNVKAIMQGTEVNYANDLYLRNLSVIESELRKYEDVDLFIESARVLRWENEIEDLLKGNIVTLKAVRKSLERDNEFKNYLPELTARLKTA